MTRHLPGIIAMTRGAYGVLLLVRPEWIGTALLGRPLDRRECGIARVVAVRQIVQAVGSGTRPGYPLLALGVEVDLLHAASMIGAGIVSHHHRRTAYTSAAFTSAAVAAAFAVAGIAAARAVFGDREATVPSGWRGRGTDLLATLLVPGYPPRDAASAPTDREEHR